jgi:hypothetical protein
VRFVSNEGSVWTTEASYVLTQTTYQGQTTLFSVGLYRCEIDVAAEYPAFKSVTVVTETGLVPSLLATPI